MRMYKVSVLKGKQVPTLNLSGYLIVALVLLSCGWSVDHQIQKNRLLSLRSEIESKHAEALETARNVESALTTANNEITQQLFEATSKNAQLETERDRAISSGTQRVYVRAKCPGMPADATSASSGNATGPELDPAYRSALSELRRGARACADQVTALQNYARLCESVRL